MLCIILQIPTYKIVLDNLYWILIPVLIYFNTIIEFKFLNIKLIIDF